VTTAERDPVTWGAESVLGLLVLYGGTATGTVGYQVGTALGARSVFATVAGVAAGLVPFAVLAFAYSVEFQVPAFVRQLGRLAGSLFLLYLAYVVAGMVAFFAAAFGVVPPDAAESLPDSVLVVLLCLPAVGLFAVLVGWYARNE